MQQQDPRRLDAVSMYESRELAAAFPSSRLQGTEK